MQNIVVLFSAVVPFFCAPQSELVPDAGCEDVYCTQFDEFPDGYVANGNPAVETHLKMADQTIGESETICLFPEEE